MGIGFMGYDGFTSGNEAGHINMLKAWHP